MMNPNMPNMPNMPGMGAMNDSLEFVKKLWGSMGVPGMNMQGMSMPGMVIPTLSVEELNKKITDLKAVESWLNLNMGMLRSTIQALEVQAATISTLQTMGETFAASMTPPGMAQSGNGKSASNNGSAAAADADDAAGADRKPDDAHQHGAPEPSSRDESDAAALTAPLVNAAAWWNMLQNQFNQAVSSAVQEVPGAAPAASSEKTKTRTRAASTGSGAPRKRKTAK